MRKKKIILAVTNDLTYDRRMYRICSSLAEAGYQVQLVGRRWNNSKPFHPVLFSGARLRCVINHGMWFYAEYNLRLFLFLLFHSFDICCACDLDTALPVRLASWIKRKRTVYDAHEFFTEVPELIGRPRVKSVWNAIGKITIPGFDLRYTVGEELAKLLKEVYQCHFEVIRNIDPSGSRKDFQVKNGERKKILLYQGALNIGRGLECCIEAMKALPDWQFWLAGQGDIAEALKIQAQEAGVGERVVFLGWVEPEQLPHLLAQVMLSVNLREKGSLNDYYSLPNKFFDALHAGLPSIHMNYPEYARICNTYPCAILLDEVKPHSLVRAIRHMEQHPEEWKKMEAACFEAAKEFTWEREAEKLVDSYAALQ